MSSCVSSCDYLYFDFQFEIFVLEIKSREEEAAAKKKLREKSDQKKNKSFMSDVHHHSKVFIDTIRSSMGLGYPNVSLLNNFFRHIWSKLLIGLHCYHLIDHIQFD